MLTREKRVHGDAGLRCEVAKAATFELVGDEHEALLLGQLFQRGVKLVEEHAAGVGRLGSGFRRGQRVFERTKIETVTGNIGFSGRFDRGGSFDFDTHSGNVDIAVPAKTDATFSVVTIAGKITNNLSKKSPIPGRFGRGAELTTELTGGGAKVSVRTFKGPVTLRMAK